ncbi:Subtilisin-like protease 2 [Penicillium hispanicum]|uniref:Subtilisin-like protease 2 n=1 Tax=Penicillium hispanicum TaxID=1080232 RepID=UPI00253FAE14|nr:Subtilisin-like protease 2 [Penicillium hispanicum]KAJ5594335.1 Subtilisin-like protease 2 [Penicillium hispanicum]
MLRLVLLPLLLVLLQSVASSPTSKASPVFHARVSRSVRGWGNEGLVENVTTNLDPPKYSYEDRYGNIHTSLKSKRATDEHSLWKRDGTVIREDSPRKEVRFWSEAPGQNLLLLTDVAYLSDAGSGAMIYVHDSGLNKDHEELTGLLSEGVTRGLITTLQPKTTEFGTKIPTVDGDPDGHGTCVADKAIGVLLGIAKSADLTMVPQAGVHNDDFMLAELQAIVDDIKSKKQTNPNFFAVVNLSYGLGQSVLDDSDLLDEYRQKYLDMVKEGALLVVASGNYAETKGREDVDDYPGLFAGEDEFKNNMIVVGSVNIFGIVARSSQGGPLVSIWAPGLVQDPEGLACASNTDNHGYGERSGTSFAAAQVSGLAAYLYSIDPSLRASANVAKAIKDKIVVQSGNSASYKRLGDWNVPSIWNMQSGTSLC